MGIEEAGICRRWGRHGVYSAAPPEAGEPEGCGCLPEDGGSRVGPAGTHKADGVSGWHPAYESCRSCQKRTERVYMHGYGPRGAMGPSSDMRALHFGQTSGGLRAGPGGLLTRGGLGAPERAWARPRARARD